MIIIGNFLRKFYKILTVYSLVVSGDKIGFRDLANKYVGVLIADKIDWNFWVLLTAVLCTLESSYKMQGPLSKYYQFFLEIWSSFLDILKQSFSLLSKLIIQFIHLSSLIRNCINLRPPKDKDFIPSRFSVICKNYCAAFACFLNN